MVLLPLLKICEVLHSYKFQFKLHRKNSPNPLRDQSVIFIYEYSQCLLKDIRNINRNSGENPHFCLMLKYVVREGTTVLYGVKSVI